MRYVELELHGSGERAIGFVEGLRAGRVDLRPVWYSRLEEVDHGGLVEALKEKLGRSSYVILPEDLARSVVAGLESSPLLGLEVVAEEDVSHAELPFECRCFSRDVAAELRRLFEEELPEGVQLEGYRVEEKVDEGAHGTEMYSPAHEYILEAQGRYVGPVEGVFALSARLDGHDFVHPGKVRLHRRS